MADEKVLDLSIDDLPALRAKVKQEADGELSDEELALVVGGKNPPDPTDGEFFVYGIVGHVRVINATGVIELYTIDGRKYKSVPATGGVQLITAPRGLIIVKNSGRAERVTVK
jgi:hypothetical protein